MSRGPHPGLIVAGLCAIVFTVVYYAQSLPTPRYDRPVVVEPEEPKYRPVAPIYTVEEITAAYEKNEVAADEQFKGKTIRITGATAKDFGTDLLGNPYITVGPALRSGETITLTYPRESKSLIASMSKGQSVVAVCTVSGKIILSVHATDCH